MQKSNKQILDRVKELLTLAGEHAQDAVNSTSTVHPQPLLAAELDAALNTAAAATALLQVLKIQLEQRTAISTLVGVPIDSGWDNVNPANIKTPDLEILVQKLQKCLSERKHD